MAVPGSGLGPTAIEKGKGDWADWLAPTLILVTPFVNFLDYHAYGLLHPESLVVIAFLAALGFAGGMLTATWRYLPLPMVPWSLPLQPVFLALALVYFVDFQPDLKKPLIHLISLVFSDGARCVPCIGSYFVAVFLLIFAIACVLGRNVGRVFTAVFAVVLATTMLFPRPAEDGRVINQTKPTELVGEATRDDLPVVVHIVLDEHIGIEGLPDELLGAEALRRDLRDFYVDNGFRVYGRAFSQYVNTGNSLSNLVNGTAQSRGELFMIPITTNSRPRYVVAQNAWFDRLTTQGYLINVYQSEYLDFCADEAHRIVSCSSYPVSGAAVLRDLQATTGMKMSLLFGYFLAPSSFNGLVKRIPQYLRNLRQTPAGAPDRWQPAALSAPWGMKAAERLAADLRTAKPGTAYIAHLLLPHRGFILDETCRLKPDPESWYDHPRLGLAHGQRLSDQARQNRYQEYFKQVRCAGSVMDGVLNALSQSGFLDRAIVIVHGDHGSRIAGLPPVEFHSSELTETDLADNFSALFAIRAPDLEAGYDSSRRSVQALFADLVLGQPISGERTVVFLAPRGGGPGADLVEYPLPGSDWNSDATASSERQ